MRPSGFSLLELLIVIAVLGILLTVAAFAVAKARDAARDRSAMAYAHNVFKAAWAHVAEEPERQLLAGDCTQGYTAGSYSVPPPGATVTFCVVRDLGNGTPQVEVVSASGRRYRLP
ncbi:type II secretion system protein [Thermus brockianus]|jgi:type IV pilus assembly protein PilA